MTLKNNTEVNLDTTFLIADQKPVMLVEGLLPERSNKVLID